MKTLMPDPAGAEASPRGEGTAEPRPATPPAELASSPGSQAWLEELAEPARGVVISSAGKFAYPGFASKRAATWEPLRQLYPGVKEGDAFVGFEDGQYEWLGQFKLFLVKFRQCWVIRDDNYELQKVTFNAPGRRSGYTEEFLTLCVIVTPHCLVPVVGFFSGTKAGAVRPAAQALLRAGTPAWLKLSPAHAASARCRVPCGRFITTVTCKPMTSKSTGHAYQLAVGQVAPTSLEEIARLEQAFGDPEFRARFEQGRDVYQARLESLESRAAAAAV
jgi:hypothetical protein